MSTIVPPTRPEQDDDSAFSYRLTCGGLPTQAEGRYTRSDRPYYFRARHGDWRLEVGRADWPTEMLNWPQHKSPEGYWRDHPDTRIFDGIDPTNGLMDDATVKKIIAAAEDAL